MGGTRDFTRFIIALLSLAYPRRPRYAKEGPPPLYGTLSHLRAEARGDYRTHSQFVDEGSNAHALSHRNPRPYHVQPKRRGNVEGHIDHEAKVTGAFIGGEDRRT